MATTLLPMWLMPATQPVQPAPPAFGPVGIDPFAHQQRIEEQRQRIEEQMRQQQEQMQRHQEEFRRQMQQHQPPLPGQFPGQ